jgi:N-acetylglutamate synthase-like GNAT family acetyltransferase
MITETIPADAPDLRAALEGAELPVEDLNDGGRTFFRCIDDGRVVGYAGYELYGEDALLRSVVVMPSDRGRGYGRKVTDAVLERAHDAGARDAYLLTTTAEAFFEHAGFRMIDRAEAPASILATKQATTICATAAMLTRTIS